MLLKKLGHISILLFFFLSSCEFSDPTATSSTDSYFMEEGDIVVTNTTNDSLHLLDSDGNFKAIIYDVENTTNVVYGVAWKSDTREVIFTVDGSDRVMAISALDGSERTFISSANLAGTLRGLTQLNDGSILVIESNNIERFTTDGVRASDGGTWPQNLGTTPEQIFATADGGFGICFRGADEVRLFDNDGTQTENVASGIGGTTDSYGCTELDDGTIAASWSGTTDTLSIYTSDLGTSLQTYSDTTLLANPRGVAQASNGNVLVADATYHQIYEIDPSDGSFVRVLAGSTLSTPVQMVVIPAL
jgi:hypothetical protein